MKYLLATVGRLRLRYLLPANVTSTHRLRFNRQGSSLINDFPASPASRALSIQQWQYKVRAGRLYPDTLLL